MYQERGRAWRRMQSERAKERVMSRQGWWLLWSPQLLSRTLRAEGYYKCVYIDVKTTRGSIEERTILGIWSKTRCPYTENWRAKNYGGTCKASDRRKLEESSYQEY